MARPSFLNRFSNVAVNLEAINRSRSRSNQAATGTTGIDNSAVCKCLGKDFDAAEEHVSPNRGSIATILRKAAGNGLHIVYTFKP